MGSYEYNAPELFIDSAQDSHQFSAEGHSSTDDFYYDGAKADVFSAGVTLFLMLTKCPPFRGAHLKDPYFRRLSAQDKKAFWKIFNCMEISEMAKDLFEKMAERDPKLRINISDIKDHPWLKSDILDEE